MFPFRRSRDPLAEPTSQSTAQYLCRLMEEQNALLRELIAVASGRPATTRRADQGSAPPKAPRTDKDVTQVTRLTVAEQEREARTKVSAPWRTPASGPASATPTPNPGTDPVSLPPATM
jgi:hypothetical protein